MFTCIGELGIGILIERRGVFLFVGKDGTPIREELIRDAIVCEDLMEHMVIAAQGFLCVKPCASDSSCSVVDRQMEVPGLWPGTHS